MFYKNHVSGFNLLQKVTQSLTFFAFRRVHVCM